MAVNMKDAKSIKNGYLWEIELRIEGEASDTYFCYKLFSSVWLHKLCMLLD